MLLPRGSKYRRNDRKTVKIGKNLEKLDGIKFGRDEFWDGMNQITKYQIGKLTNLVLDRIGSKYQFDYWEGSNTHTKTTNKSSK